MTESLTIVEMVDRHMRLFCITQTWYRAETFATVPRACRIVDGDTLNGFVSCSAPAPPLLYRAVDLLALYVRTPTDPQWRQYIWTSDVDREGQRVFIGKNRGLMEIHRHLHLTRRWGVVTWKNAPKNAPSMSS